MATTTANTDSVFSSLDSLVADLRGTVASLKKLEAQKSVHLELACKASALSESLIETESSVHAELAYQWSEHQKIVQKHLHVVQPALVAATAACSAAEQACLREGATLQEEHNAMEEAITLLRERSASFVLTGWKEDEVKRSTEYASFLGTTRDVSEMSALLAATSLEALEVDEEGEESDEEGATEEEKAKKLAAAAAAAKAKNDERCPSASGSVSSTTSSTTSVATGGAVSPTPATTTAPSSVVLPGSAPSSFSATPTAGGGMIGSISSTSLQDLLLQDVLSSAVAGGKSPFANLETLVGDLETTLQALKDLETHNASSTSSTSGKTPRTQEQIDMEKNNHLELGKQWAELRHRMQRHLRGVQPALVAAAAACVAAEHACALESATLLDEHDEVVIVRQLSSGGDSVSSAGRRSDRSVSPAHSRRDISPARARLPSSGSNLPSVVTSSPAPVQLMQVQQQHPHHPGGHHHVFTPITSTTTTTTSSNASSTSRNSFTKEDRNFIASAMGAKFIEEDKVMLSSSLSVAAGAGTTTPAASLISSTSSSSSTTSSSQAETIPAVGTSATTPLSAFSPATTTASSSSGNDNDEHKHLNDAVVVVGGKEDSDDKKSDEEHASDDDDFVPPIGTPAPPPREQVIDIHQRCSQRISADGRHVEIKCDCAPLFADVLDANARASLNYTIAAPTAIARIGLAVVTCVDSRIDPLAMFGLECGDAAFLRNAGARVSDDVIRSLAAATAVLGITRIAVVAHTKCKMASVTQEQVVSAVIAGGGDPTAAAAIDYLTTANQDQTVLDDVMKLRKHAAIRPGTVVAGFVLDMDTSILRTVDNGEYHMREEQ